MKRGKSTTANMNVFFRLVWKLFRITARHLPAVRQVRPACLKSVRLAQPIAIDLPRVGTNDINQLFLFEE
jgi:hypothetical protein